MHSDLSSRIKQCAIDAGFDLCGIAPVSNFRELQVFPNWIADGKHGEMKYMEARTDTGELKRESLARVAPWARSVIVCALNYNTAHPYSTHVGTDAFVRPGFPANSFPRNNKNKDELAAASKSHSFATPHATRGWISRYAWGQKEYHDSVLRRLRNTEIALRTLLAETGYSVPRTDDPIQLRSYVDTGPLIERVYAKYAGIGWIAKNTCIINQQLGSWLFLGVILTSLGVTKLEVAKQVTKKDVTENKATQKAAAEKVAEKDVRKEDVAQSRATKNHPAKITLTADLPAPDRCGTCTRCIAACPTQAIIAPGELDARLCISYLTIEKRGEIPEALRPLMGRHVFGCDICQDVCPWNRKAPITSAAEFEPREKLVNPDLDWLAKMQPEEFQTVFHGSPVRRAKLSGLRRNAVIAMANSANKTFIPTLKQLGEDPDPQVADHARWAQAKLDEIKTRTQ